MLASLPMYDFPEMREATDSFWAAIAKAYGTSGGLTRDEDWTAPWRNPDLLFSQTCGYPFTHEYAGVLKYVATPHYAADGCDGPNYCSIIFARKSAPLETFRGKIAAFNNRDSMSGMLALQLVFAPMARQGQFFTRAIDTGGHLGSLQALQEGMADVCATDCVTVALLKKYRPQVLDGLVEIVRSPSVPGLPFVTRGCNVPGLRGAIADVMQSPATRNLRDSLLLRNVSVLSETAYDVIKNIESRMNLQGGLLLDEV